jgi:hypothetical protein
MAFIALVGSAARTRLKETPEFVDMKRRIKKAVEESSHDGLEKAAELLKKTNILWKEKVNKRTALSYFFISCGFPACFYIAYIYSANILKVTYHYSPEQIIKQNFIVSLFHCGSFLLYSFLSAKINPLTILRVKLFIFSPFVIISPYILSISSTPLDVLFFQCFIMTFGITDVPGSGIFINHFPILKRFTSTSLMYAFSRAIVYVITSFGLVYLADTFGHYGLWIIMIPLSIAFFFGIRHFEVLEYETHHDNPETALRKPLTTSSAR